MSKTVTSLERALWVAGPVILFVVMFAHMTAVENIAVGLLALGTAAAACSPERPAPRHWPLLLPIACWAGWGLASLAWSGFPAASRHAWFDEVLYPFLAFFGFWLIGTQTERAGRVVVVNWLACLLLAAISAACWGRLQPPTPNTFPLHFYDRVGHTSTLAMFAMTLFSGLMLRVRRPVLGVSGLLLCLFIGLATLNRFFWVAAAVTLAIAFFPLYRRHAALMAMAAVVIGVAGVGALEWSASLRIGAEMPAPAAREVKIAGEHVYVPGFLAAIGDTMSSDTRPKLWAFYARAGQAHPWIGIGFGKPLPGMVYGKEMPPSLLSLEPQARTHAHNVFLNTWLQTGIIGVVLQAVLLVALIGRFWSLRRVVPWISAAGIALVIGMIVKNMTDDFMWQSTALAFWGFAGLLLGQGQRIAGRVAPARAARAGH